MRSCYKAVHVVTDVYHVTYITIQYCEDIENHKKNIIY